MMKVKEMMNRFRGQKIATSTSDARQSVISKQRIVIAPGEIVHLQSADLLKRPCLWCMENKIDKWRNAGLFHSSERFLKGAESGCSRCLLSWAGVLKLMDLKGVCLEELRTPHTKKFFEDFQKAEVDWLQLRFFTKFDQRPCSSPMVGTHRTLNGTRRSRVDSIVVEWLRECVEKHDCQGSTATLPSRVLDVSQSSEGGISLYVTDQEIEPYAALSHCWGGEVPMKTTTLNYEAQQNHIAVDELPPNFKDAIEVTRRLGLRYLWIDALCIIQDDLSDWEVESREMSRIYGDAHLVIGADGAKGAEEGFLRDSPEYNSIHADGKSALIAVVDDEQADVYVFECPEHYDTCSLLDKAILSEQYEDVVENPLSQRAWAFQEQLLARRMVHFTKEEMVWECRSRYRCECTQFDDSGQRTSKDDWISGDTAKMGVQWYSFVNEVCVRQLTFKTDILPCLSGLAAQMEASMMGRYLAGLWEEDLLLGLTWSYKQLQTRIVPQQAPSWSWASLEGRSSPYWLLRQEWESIALKVPHAQILDAQCIAKGQNAYGAVSQGHIKMIAPFVRVEVMENHNAANEVNPSHWIMKRLAVERAVEVSEAELQLPANADSHLSLEGHDFFYAVLIAEIACIEEEYVGPTEESEDSESDDSEYEPADDEQERKLWEGPSETFGLIIRERLAEESNRFERVGSFSGFARWNGENPFGNHKKQEVLNFFGAAQERTIMLL